MDMVMDMVISKNMQIQKQDMRLGLAFCRFPIKEEDPSMNKDLHKSVWDYLYIYQR